MNRSTTRWLKSGHRHTATCVECHLPHTGLAKWVAKAEHGFRHSAAFTLQNFKEPIEITPRDRELVPSQLRALPRRARPGDRRRCRTAPTERSTACTATPAPATAPAADDRGRSMPASPGVRLRSWTAGVLASWSAIAGVTVLLLALLTNIFERKQEARQPFVRVVEVTEDTMDPKVWGQNWPLPVRLVSEDRAADDDQVRRARPRRQRRRPGRAEARPRAVAEAHLRGLRVLDRLPRPARPRLHALRPGADPARDRAQAARRLPAVPRLEPGRCTASSGKGDVRRASSSVSGMPYAGGARPEGRRRAAAHRASGRCVDCHDPDDHGGCASRGPASSTASRRSRPSRASPTTIPTATPRRQEMRSFVCGQCHVEYYFKGPGKVVTYPWANGLKVEEIEAYYDEEGFTDWMHAETGDQGAQGAASRVRGVEPGRPRARRRGRAPTATCRTSATARSR